MLREERFCEASRSGEELKDSRKIANKGIEYRFALFGGS
jgi:hypothetical protein